MDKKYIYWWSGVVIVIVALVAFLVVDSRTQLRNQQMCQSLRIRPLNEKFFHWEGILDLNSRAEYQPKCI